MAITSSKKKSKSYPLRLSPSMRRELEAVAKREGISLNQMICLAVAEKITRVGLESDLEGSEIASGKNIVGKETGRRVR